MAKERQKPTQPRRPFYDEPGYTRCNPYLLRVKEQFPERLVHPCEAMERRGHWDDWCQGRPLHVEIGPGKGRFITEYALANPEVCVLGIEIKFRRVYKVAKRLTQAGATNAFMLRFDANFLPFIFAAGELSKVMVFFPDPWAAKERQRYRRMVDGPFLEALTDLLVSGGRFELKTDHQERFGEYLDDLRNSPLQLLAETRDLAHSSYVEHNIRTIFERKFDERDIPACYMLAEKP